MAENLVLDKLKFNYDPESDVLYINFDEPMAADDSDITDEGVIVRLRANRIVGFTVLNARKSVYSRKPD
jgi:uncharacterized protein YuzE